MSCHTCSNCRFVNFPSPEPQLQTLKTIQSFDGLVSHILRGSRPLLNSDHALMEDEIAKLEQLRFLYDAQFQEIQLRQFPVLKALKNRVSIYSPIRRLPRDILIEIFHYVCSSDAWGDAENAIGRDSLNMAGPLWVLGRVCGFWRDTLNTSPAFWARNVLVITPVSKHAHEICQTYLRCAGEHPLGMRIDYWSNKRAEDDEILSLLLQSCYRWKDAYIRIDRHNTHYLESISHLPVLKTIEIDIWNDDGNDYRLSLGHMLECPAAMASNSFRPRNPSSEVTARDNSLLWMYISPERFTAISHA
ncbi:uncharacterized protein BT62DRAFT_993799 [Guyanagaster necrorhizus]|uniref:F-box domain-containing protein n=1 Tax=Guyanagaster necrorhizus TaxID=856835 RepID=A0A9P7VUF9_9AGAR|nr:uncharacterized protein BT62DRAFT_993799 [Guyanagaster necrorhizus MCA 3950]KAG7446935.1 hypothetical protein BT62DRAFT_993799 [Guyanagaster necrorhizus MCA 3950]